MVTVALARAGLRLEQRLDPSRSAQDTPVHLALRVPATAATLVLLVAAAGLDAVLREVLGYESKGLAYLAEVAVIIYPLALVMLGAVDNLRSQATRRGAVTVAAQRSYDLLGVPTAFALAAAFQQWA